MKWGRFRRGAQPMSLKRQARARRLAVKRESRKERWAQIRCWWRWPLRHEFVDFGLDHADRRCVECGMPEAVQTQTMVRK